MHRYEFDDDRRRAFCVAVAKFLRVVVNDDSTTRGRRWKIERMNTTEHVNHRRWYCSAMAPAGCSIHERNVGETEQKGSITIHYFNPLTATTSARFLVIAWEEIIVTQGDFTDRDEIPRTYANPTLCFRFIAVMPRVVREAACVLLARFVELLHGFEHEDHVQGALESLMDVAYALGSPATLPVVVDTQRLPQPVDQLIAMAHGAAPVKDATVAEAYAFEGRLVRGLRYKHEAGVPLLYRTRVWETEGGGRLWVGTREPDGATVFMQHTLDDVRAV
jgi:hypothetical protein